MASLPETPGEELIGLVHDIGTHPTPVLPKKILFLLKNFHSNDTPSLRVLGQVNFRQITAFATNLERLDA